MDMIQRWIAGSTEREGFTQIESGVFRDIEIPEGGQESPVAEKGDSLSLRYGIFRFTSGFSGSKSEVIFTNQAELMPERVTWSRDPLKVVLGDGQLMKGVEDSLEGSAPGDVVTVILTSSNAYEDHTVQQLPPNTPVAWIINVNEVKKN